ncbi:hypothetical protein TWF225_005120 [Orbilia oligospora]|nr:hypothetical protein TWF225_005120 [Orbilia oligospora]KAF3241509.1 hypothetical protein TWF128_010997 [Orbilia oligospora]KAF3249334.1 hypothetical protein TWF217_008931 [Orbilia oligospora]
MNGTSTPPNIPREILSLKDLEAKCLETMAPMVRDYLYDGAEEGHTIRENLEVWDRWLVIPRMMRDTSNVNLTPRTHQFNQSWSLPLGIAPSAMQQLAHPFGEKATAAAARSMNIPFGLSTFSNYTIEEVKDAGGDSVVGLQIYLLEGRRDLNIELVKRAEAAGYKAIVLTVDSPVPGNRPGLIKSNFVMLKHMRFRNFSEDFGGPLDQAQDTQFNDDSVTASIANSSNPDSAAACRQEQTTTSRGNQLIVDPSINWERDMTWLREHTSLEIWVKGVLHPLDAEEAIAHGASGIMVSNHGGRQLDTCVSALDVLPAIVKQVNGRVPVHLDGGIRRGGDIFKALALGADFVWIGRPVWWGLEVAGEEGVRWVIQTLKREFEVVMKLMGCRHVGEIKREMVVTKDGLLSMGGTGVF